MWIVYVSMLVLFVKAQQDELAKNSVEMTTEEPSSQPFTFKPEVLRKFRIVLKRIFDFDRLFNTPPNELFTFPESMRQPTPNAFQFLNSPRNINNDRQFLEETAEVPETNQDDQRRRYEQYWRDYYYRNYQQQQNPYGPYGNNQNILYGNQFQNPYYQQQQYSPYYYNQQFQSPYGQQQNGFSIGSGLWLNWGK